MFIALALYIWETRGSEKGNTMGTVLANANRDGITVVAINIYDRHTSWLPLACEVDGAGFPRVSGGGIGLRFSRYIAKLPVMDTRKGHP